VWTALAATGPLIEEEMMVLQVCSRQTMPALRADLLDLGFAVHVLNGYSISDEGSLLQAFARDVPFEVFHPGDVTPPVNWNAFGDCLSTGIGSCPETQVAIFWDGADRMLDGNLPLFLNTVECLIAEARRVGSYDPPILLVVCLVGDGPNFPDSFIPRNLFGPDPSEFPVAVIYLPRVNGDKAV
jgi:hypothetical protein